MPAIAHVIRRGAVYYWRRRLPSALAESPRSATLIIGLRTKDPRRARFLAGQITALADLFLADAMNQRLTQSQIQAIFRDVFTRHLDKLEAVAARERIEQNFDAEDNRRSDLVMGWVYRLFETRGAAAQVDDHVSAQMRDQGMTADAITEISAMLDLMRENNLLSERPERLKTLVKTVGGAPTPMNLALTQEAIYRAMADANFQTGRRYDGVRTEAQNWMETIHRDRLPQHAYPAQSGAEYVQSSANSDFSQPSGPDGPRQEARRTQAHEEKAQSLNQAHAVLGKAEMPGDENAPPPLQDRPLQSMGPPVVPTSHPIAVLGAQLIKKNATVWDIKTQRQASQIYGLLAKLLCEKSVYELTELRQSHFADLDDLLASVAKSYGKSVKDEARTTSELRAIGAAKPPSERGLAPETVNRHMTFLGQLLTFIRGRGHVLDRDIDLKLLRAKTRGRARDKRSIFKRTDLDAVFALPCFTGSIGWKGYDAFTPGPHVFHRALYFAIVLLYYTGARREEICGLEVDDISFIEQPTVGEKLSYIRIAPNEARRIKNDQSSRFIALHPELDRLGFFEYVEAIKALGYQLVFPDLKSPGSSAPLGDRLYDEFSRGLLKAVPDARERKKVIHSLRKTFGDSLKQNGVAAEIRGDIMGHGGSTVTEEIYCDPIALSAMLNEVKKLPVVTANLERSQLLLLPWVTAREAAPHSRKGGRGGQ